MCRVRVLKALPPSMLTEVLLALIPLAAIANLLIANFIRGDSSRARTGAKSGVTVGVDATTQGSMLSIRLELASITQAHDLQLLSEKPGRKVFRLQYNDGSTSIAKIADRAGSRAAAGLFAEAQALSFLEANDVAVTPNLLSIHKFPSGTPCLIRTDCRGNDLHRHLSYMADRGKWPTVGQAFSVLVAASRATAQLHNAQLVHGDLKPANLIFHFERANSLTFSDVPRVIDFDSAQFCDSAVSVAKAGTLGFSAPERYFASNPFKQSDVYSLGEIGCFLFTGRPALVSTNDRIPKPLQPILEKARDEKLFDRYDSAESFLSDLERVASEIPKSQWRSKLDWPKNWRDEIEPVLTTTIFFNQLPTNQPRQERIPSDSISSISIAIENVMRESLSPEEIAFTDRYFDAGMSTSEFAEANSFTEEQRKQFVERLEAILARARKAIHTELQSRTDSSDL